jgi:hypothetical protein
MEVNNYFLDSLRGRFRSIFSEVNIESEGAQKADHNFLCWFEILHINVVSVSSGMFG